MSLMQRPFVRLFGAPAFLGSDGSEVPLAAERRNQLLAYLACCRRWVTRDELAALLWVDRDQASARSNLRNVVLQVRRAASEAFETSGDALRWSIASDVQAFDAALAERAWQAALDAYTGPLLEGFELGAPAPFSDWLRFERARLQTQWGDAVRTRLDELSGAPHECAALARRILHQDQLNESAIAAFIGAQTALGAAAEAQRTWREYCVRLVEEHGVEPSMELRSLAMRAQPKGATTPAVVPAAGGWVGRRLELRQVRELLADDGCRILTLTGPGGVGKSTLARVALSHVGELFGDNTVWVALEDLSHIDEVVPRLAERIGLVLNSGASPLSQVLQHLRERRMLLVFDNAEHLSGLDRQLLTPLRECAGLKLLLTSRVRLGAADEWLMPLEGLPVPDAEERDVEVLRAFDAVQLFELRARALAPSFDIAAQAHHVAALAAAVDGLPLALELAAAWARLLPVSEIVAELQRSLDVLETPGGADARERSLRASFEHSWRLLAPVERDVLPRLAVFAGAFSRAAAEDVAIAPLPVLAGLVDKSLLRADGNGGFSMHSLLRQCARERLSDHAAVRLRHADYYARLVGRFDIAGARTVSNQEIDQHLADVLVAWHTSVQERLPGHVERMAMPLGRFFDARGRANEGIALLEAAQRVFAAHTLTERRACARVRWNLANLLFRVGRFEEMETAVRAALAEAAALRDREAIAGCLNTLGLCLWQRGLHADARACYERGLRRARADRDGYQADKIEQNLAIVEKIAGDYDAALARHERLLVGQRQAGDQDAMLQTLNNIGNLHRARGDPRRAVPYLEEGLRLCRNTGFEGGEPFLVLNLALAYLGLRELDLAQRFAQSAFELARSRNVRQIEVGAPLVLAHVATGRGCLALALERIRESLLMARENNYSVWQVSACVAYAHLLGAQGSRQRAAVYWYFVLADSRTETTDSDDARRALESLALSHGEETTARAAAGRLTLDGAVEEILAAATGAKADAVHATTTEKLH
jgi:predicted ATPase/DNA-binding SARP family transcriptional activator